MDKNRRNFIRNIGALGAITVLGFPTSAHSNIRRNPSVESKPWIEISREAYLHNAGQIAKMAAGKPVVAVLKNNAYGIGAAEVGSILDDSPHVHSMAVVKDESALEMRSAGVTKPILLMGDFDTNLSVDLMRQDITLSVHSRDSMKKITEIARSATSPIKVAIYIDTGLGRMGIPRQQVLDLVKIVGENTNLEITQTFSTLTTPRDFAIDQIDRFNEIISQFRELGIDAGLKHLAPSYSLLDVPDSHQDAVRPGILLHGSFPLAHMEMADDYPLIVPYRLKAPVIRLEKLYAGDTIGFSRFYKIEKDEWIATLPIGWADGYDSGAENGAKVLLGGKLYSVVNVNASHANISLGDTTEVKVGDTATLIGPEKPEITPEGFGKLVGGHNYLQINYKESIGKKVYDRF